MPDRMNCTVSSIAMMAAVVITTLMVQGCASGGAGLPLAPGSIPSVTGYQAGNAVAPQGYQISAAGDGAVRITATGSASTPNERLLKIALARAAQYGAEQNMKFFRASEPAYQSRCGKTSFSERGQTKKITPIDYRVVQIDVTYAKTASGDAASRPSKETAASLLAELQAETIPPEAQAALVAQLAQACGRNS